MAKLKTKACPGCGGAGSVPADDVGPLLKEEREKASIKAVDMANYVGLSDTYLYDLERGNRRWTNELLASYQRGLKELKEAVNAG